jgi:hypothetical protein
VRTLLRWIVVTVGIAILGRWLRRRREESRASAVAAPAEDPAEELRRKLAESREPEPEGAPETPEGTVAERRADVHAQARATLSQMTPPDES